MVAFGDLAGQCGGVFVGVDRDLLGQVDDPGGLDPGAGGESGQPAFDCGGGHRSGSPGVQALGLDPGDRPEHWRVFAVASAAAAGVQVEVEHRGGGGALDLGRSVDGRCGGGGGEVDGVLRVGEHPDRARPAHLPDDPSPSVPSTVAVSSSARSKAWASGESTTGFDPGGAVGGVVLDPDPAGLGRRLGAAFGEVGLTADDRRLHALGDPGQGEPVGELGELGVDETGGGGVEGDGLLGDPAGLPHRQPPRHHLGPQPREPVPELDDLPDVVPCALLRHRQGDREVGDRELPHRERTLTGQPQDPLGAQHTGLVGQPGRLLRVCLEVLGHLQRVTGADPLVRVGDPVTVRPRGHGTELGHLSPLGARPVLGDAGQHRLLAQTRARRPRPAPRLPQRSPRPARRGRPRVGSGARWGLSWH